MTQIGPETAFELIRRLVADADERGAQMMVTVCPMCQMNVDAYQNEMNNFFGTDYHMPILFFTQLMGVAFGLDPKDLGFGLELTSARKAMSRVGVETPEPQSSAPRPRKDSSLPMPKPLPTKADLAEKVEAAK